MIVPQFWAEGKAQTQFDGRQVTVRRFGWSDESEAAAQWMADERAREALARIAAGEDLPRREPKRAYNGAEGVPIREEIVSRHGETIITRNSYGALCLNTPNVLFADIDFQNQPSCGLTLSVIVVSLACAAALGWVLQSWIAGVVAGVAAIALGYAIATLFQRLLVGSAGGPEQQARGRALRFLSRHPDWHVRLYRTPSGMRVLAMHQTFDPHDPIVAECFQALGTDPIYVRMCLRQNCFRARVSPKPWRVGIEQHLRPRPGIWPINPERLPERRRWVDAYEKAAASFASCAFLEALGSGRVHPAAAEVQRLHDDLSRASVTLPLA